MKDKAPDIRILTVRDQKVVLDTDLAAVYGVTTKRLNEQFRRNRKRFPEDFCFSTDGEGIRKPKVANCDQFQKTSRESLSAVGLH